MGSIFAREHTHLGNTSRNFDALDSCNTPDDLDFIFREYGYFELDFGIKTVLENMDSKLGLFSDKKF